jgi:hypothetical protein
MARASCQVKASLSVCVCMQSITQYPPGLLVHAVRTGTQTRPLANCLTCCTSYINTS